MDINRVELKGRVSTDVIYRKNSKGEYWATFPVVTNEINSQAKVDREKSVPTYTNVAVFNTKLVERIREVGIHQGSHVWVIGKLFTKQVEKGGYIHPYTSVAAQEVVVIKTKNDNPTDIPTPSPSQSNESVF